MNHFENTELSLRRFTTLTAIAAKTIAELAMQLTFDANETIIKQGHEVKGVYLILHGEAAVMVRLPGGQEIKLSVLTDGDFFGDVVLIRGGAATATIKANKKTHCLFLSTEIYKALCLLEPSIGYHFLVYLTHGICERMISGIEKLTGNLHDIHKNKYQSIKSLTVEKMSYDKISYNYLADLAAFKHFTYSDLMHLIPYAELILIPRNRMIDNHSIEHSEFVIVEGALGIVSEDTKLGVLGVGNHCTHAYHPISPEKYNISLPITFVSREECVLLSISHQKLTNLYTVNQGLYFKWHASICFNLASLLHSINKQLIRYQSEFPERSFIKNMKA